MIESGTVRSLQISMKNMKQYNAATITNHNKEAKFDNQREICYLKSILRII